MFYQNASPYLLSRRENNVLWSCFRLTVFQVPNSHISVRSGSSTHPLLLKPTSSAVELPASKSRSVTPPGHPCCYSDLPATRVQKLEATLHSCLFWSIVSAITPVVPRYMLFILQCADNTVNLLSSHHLSLSKRSNLCLLTEREPR